MDEYVVLSISQLDQICQANPNSTIDDGFGKTDPEIVKTTYPHSLQENIVTSTNFASESGSNIAQNELNDTQSDATHEPEIKKKNQIRGLNKRAIPLYKYLEKKSPLIDWNQDRELLLSSTLIPNSNIYTLLNDATNNNKDSEIKSNEASWRVFRQWLRDNKVPSDLVNNKVLQEENLPPMLNQPNPENFPTIQIWSDAKAKQLFKN